ncbi:MAG: hypothetical protein WBO92_01595 [Candidatus Moraniibacteriota bacterium]
MEGGSDKKHTTLQGQVVEIIRIIVYDEAGTPLQEFSEEEIMLGFTISQVIPKDGSPAGETGWWRLTIGRAKAPLIIEGERVEFWDSGGRFGDCGVPMDATPCGQKPESQVW